MEIQFRSRDGNVLHVASKTGHAARIGPEWRELPPILHAEAIAAGAITNNMTSAAIEAKQEGAAPAFDTADEIRKAIIVMLEEEDATNFTGAGLPNLNKLSARCGFSVDREEMQRVWAELKASIKADA